MYKHPMLSVKEAAALLGCDERWVREKLNQGLMKGEKKTIGMKEKWFVYKGEVDAAVARKGASAQTHSAQDQINFEPIIAEAIEAESVEPLQEKESPYEEHVMGREAIKILAEEMVRPLVETIKRQADELNDKERKIEEQNRQLRLLPDIEKREELARKAAELKELEVEALCKQIGALEEEKRAAVDEVERVRSEKEAKDKQIESQLTELTDKLKKLEQPWWKKLFAPGSES